MAGMKATFIALLAVLLCLVGCGKKEQSNNTNASDKTPAKTESTLEDKVVGEYEYKEPGWTARLVLMENGTAQSYSDDKKKFKGKWEIMNKNEIYVEEKDQDDGILRINLDGSLTYVAERESDGSRTDLDENKQITYKKIK